MFNIIETILIKIFSVLPDASTNSSVISAVNNAFITINPVFAKINLIFPVFVLFKIFLLVLFIEMTLFLFGLVMQIVKSLT